MKFEAKIDHKKVKAGDPDSVFEAVAEGYMAWMKALKDFAKLNYSDQQEFFEVFAKDMNALLLILYEYSHPRTDDVTDRGNQI